jgi:hypothetical protein
MAYALTKFKAAKSCLSEVSTATVAGGYDRISGYQESRMQYIRESGGKLVIQVKR